MKDDKNRKGLMIEIRSSMFWFWPFLPYRKDTVYLDHSSRLPQFPGLLFIDDETIKVNC